MASASFNNLLVHGPSVSSYHPEDDGLPNIYINFSYNISVPSGSNLAQGTLYAGLRALQSGYIFGYAIRCTGWIGNDSSKETIIFDKPNSRGSGYYDTWSDLYYNGTESFTATPDADGNIYVHLRIYSDCTCRNPQYGSEFYIWERDGLVNVATYNTPSKPILTSDKNLVDNGTNVIFSYSKDTNYSYGTEYIQYSLNKSSIEGSMQVTDSAGSFTYNVNPGAGKSITMYCRRYLIGGSNTLYSDWSDGLTIYTKSNYAKPSKPTITCDKTIVATGSKVKFSYSEDTNNIDGTKEEVQYSYDKSNWTGIEGSNKGSGYFELILNGDAGTTETIYCRRKLKENSVYSDISDPCSVNIYTNPTVNNISVTPASTVNGNSTISVSWNSWSGHTGEICYSSVELVESTQSSKIIATLGANISGNTLANKSLSSYDLFEDYDNTTIYIKVTRTNVATKVSASGYTEFKVKYKPTSKITNMTTISDKTIRQNTSISWSYPSGYNGVVSGYVIILHQNGELSTDDDITEYVPNASYTIDVSKLLKNKYYDIYVIPYYYYDGIGYYIDSSIYEYENYFRYIADSGVPLISYPKGGLWPSGYNTFKVVIKLPKDPNISVSESKYRYRDVEVYITTGTVGTTCKISEYPNAFSCNYNSPTDNNLEYERSIIFDISKSSASDGWFINSPLYIKSRVLTMDGVWSSYSTSVLITRFNLDDIKLNEGDIIKASNAVSISNYCINISRTNNVIDSVTAPSVGDIIYKSYFDSLHDRLLSVYNITKSEDIIDDKNLKYNLDSYTEKYSPADGIIRNTGYIDYLFNAIKKLCNIN